MSNNTTILYTSPLQLLLSIHIIILYLHYTTLSCLIFITGWVYLVMYCLIVLLEQATASFALRSVFQLRHLASYSYRIAQGGTSRYQPPVYEDDLFVHAYPVEAFSNTVLQPQPCYSIDEEQQSTRRGEEDKCPSLLEFVAMMVVNPVQYIFDRIDK